MLHSVMAQLLVPFLITCAIPGILFAPLMTRQEELGLLSFLVRVALGGIFFQSLISFATGITAFAPIAAHIRILIISFIVIGIIIWRLGNKKDSLRIRIGAYEIASLMAIAMLLLVLRGHFREITPPYFNPASDQYYWLAYAEASLHNPAFIAAKIFTSQIHRPVFFLMLAPYVAFLPKHLPAYQDMMIIWTYAVYALIGIAMAELARITLTRKMLGIMAMPMLFSFHWINYYLISGDVAPQGIAIFFLITGFILLKEKADLKTLWIFLGTFYAIHLGTLAIFGLIVGMATILRENIRIGKNIIKKKNVPMAPWHLLEKIFVLPTAAVSMLYALYAAGIFSYFKPSLILYYSQYEEYLTLFTQPYFGKEQSMLIWMGIIGVAISVLREKEREIAMGFIVPWMLLATPLLAYHAFHASWQSFRYYLFLYPSAVLLTLLLVEWVADAITAVASRGIGKGFIFMISAGFMPVFVLAASNQQKMVFLDMIEGRDSGVIKNERYHDMEKMLSIADSLHDPLFRPVAIYPYAALSTSVQWAFAPRETLTINDICNETNCPITSTLLPTITDFINANPAVLLISKKEGIEQPIDEQITRLFIPAGETDGFQIYSRK